MPIRLYILDDHELIISGLRSDLQSFPTFEIVGSHTDPRVGLEEILSRRQEIDIVVADIEMPHLSGFQVCNAIKEGGHQPRVVYLTYHMSPETRYRAMRTKMDGITYKNATATELATFLEAVHTGDNVVIGNVQRPPTATSVTAVLTTREQEVLYYLACLGLTNSEVAERMHRSKDTIETHRKNIMSKLGLKNTVELVHYAMSANICSDPPPTN